MSFKRFLIWSSGVTVVLRSKNIYAILVEGIYGEQSSEIILNLDQWFRCPSKKKFTDGRQMKSDHNSSPLAQVS